jgi:tetratricopeptide (TPR) repeat protein
MRLIFVVLLLIVGLCPQGARAQSVSARNKFKLGRSQFEKGNYKEAIGYLEQALKEEPLYPDAQYVEGLCYLGLSDYKKAKEKLEYCIGLDPTFMPAHQYLGEICLRQKDYTGAKAVFAKMAQVPGGNPSATYCLGVVAYALKDLPGAEKEWMETLKLDPKMARARNNLGVLHRVKEQHQQALADFKSAALLASDNPAYLLNVAIEQFELGDKPGARLSCERVQRLSNQRYDVGFMAVALDAYVDGQWDRCLKATQSALGRNPDMTSALLFQARAYEKLKKIEDARASYKAALESDPNLVVATKALAALPPEPSPTPSPGPAVTPKATSSPKPAKP